MATLKAEVQGKRKDGTYLVYIRVTHNRRNSYLKTPWVVMENGVVRGKKEVVIVCSNLLFCHDFHELCTALSFNFGVV